MACISQGEWISLVAKRNHFYYVAERVGDPFPNRFVIIETMQTSDGWRDRITHSAYETLAEANDFIRTIEERSSSDFKSLKDVVEFIKDAERNG